MSKLKTLLPAGWRRPKGYANGISTRGQLIVTAGLVGWNGQERFIATNFAGQLRQVLINALAILREDGAGPEHIVRMTWYIIDKEEYLGNLEQIGLIYREIIGKNFPAMSVVQVVALIEPQARLEIEFTAIVPDPQH